MTFDLTSPCSQCPFLEKMAHGFTIERLEEFASGTFHCHRTGTNDDETGDFVSLPDSLHCAGALIFLEKQHRPNQMMRIGERLGLYDHRRLNMAAPVREVSRG